ncbi:MAG: alpha-amylase family glycosyl hydrolase [Elusimicrobia bacterium]|nr:alpha-amylase family glycosyl hydrolase [Elusimicrobiota bacterium]
MLTPALLSLAPLFAAPLHAQTPALAQAAALVEDLGSARNAPSMAPALKRFYDGAPRNVIPVRADTGGARSRQLRSLLSLGTMKSDGSMIGPFVFRPAGGGAYTAPAAGLEGFVYGEGQARAGGSADSIRHHLRDYGRYLEDLLAPVPWAAEARRHVKDLLSGPGSDAVKYDQLMAFVRQYTETLRAQVAASDQSQWVRQARIYEIFPRAYNLAGKRAAMGRPAGAGAPFFADFGTQDLRDIQGLGFDTLWVMGIFPIGRRNQSGTGGGSPYSIQDHESLNPELGTPEDFRGFVARAHALGLKVIIDFVPNHTAMDSKLIESHPEYFLHSDSQPAGEGWFAAGPRWIRHGGFSVFGSVSFWKDTAQVDYSNESLRRELVRIERSWVERFGVDGFRVDMAYLDLNANFSRTWGVSMPPREFMEMLITAVKAAYPATAFIAESYDNWDELSACGFDLVYGKNDMGRPGGHTGWYDAVQSRDPGRIRAALARVEYLQWQKGGSDMLDFIGNHDEPSPARAFGPWMRGASLLSLLLPGAQLFYGSQEIGFDAGGGPGAEPKSIPFDVPVQVDWKAADAAAARFYQDTFRAAAAVRARLRNPSLKALSPQGEPAWVGYALVAADAQKPGALVLANPTDRTVAVDFHDPRLDTGWTGTLPAYGYAVVEPSSP